MTGVIQQAPPAQAVLAKVFDIGDPGAHGVVVRTGPEVSEVQFDDGRQRNIPNRHLRSIDAPVADDGLCWHNPSSVSEVVRLGQEAMSRKRRGWDDWLLIAEALQVGRTEVMRAVHTNEPSGRRYEKAMADWLLANGFKEIDKSVRKRLLDCLKHKAEIEKWRAQLTDSERFKFNHPDTVLRKWKASTVVPDPNAPAKVSPYQKLQADHMALIEERDRYKREVERGGGDLWTPQDRPRDIARVIIDKVGTSKALSIVEEIRKAVKAAARLSKNEPKVFGTACERRGGDR
jgi:hypothetical protein